MSQRIRGFEVIKSEFRQYPEMPVILPHRATRWSAGYDFHCLHSAVIPPGEIHAFATDIKAYMQPNEVLHLYPRSSYGIKMGIMIANTIPTIDADYYNNPNNDGHIVIYLRNLRDTTLHIAAGDRIAQGVFSKYLIADNEPEGLPERRGGVGHTGR